MTDVQLFGLDAGRHHLTSLMFHLANTILLFLILNRVTKARLRSVFVAALFAVYPLHVETVVWIADRKDILCAFFWLNILTLSVFIDSDILFWHLRGKPPAKWNPCYSVSSILKRKRRPWS